MILDQTCHIDGPIEGERERFFESIRKAVNQAFAEGIQANSIIINKNMVRVPEFFMQLPTGNVVMMPKMICGLNVYLTKDELPDGYSFAVLERPNDRLTEFESIGMEPDELRKAARIYRAIRELQD